MGAKVRNRSNEQGFTLLEMIFAISILTVGILGVASMQVASIRGNAFSIGTTEATTRAADHIEKLMDLTYSDNDLDQSQNPHQVTQGRYTITWNVSDDAVIADTKTVNVIVAWKEHGVQKNIRMNSIIPRII
jgi:type IV pilus assembly protein PilV